MNLSIGERIAALRKERQITQTQLAEYLFLVPQTISKWEVGGGTPEISLLPKIAAFFGVSIDELFGMSDLERVENLVCRYSVLRDEQSFREASECLHARRQAVEVSLQKRIGDVPGLEQEKERLDALEMHLFLQQSRESAARALKMAEELIFRTGNMAYRLQRLQLRAMLGEGAKTLEECERDFRADPGPDTLRVYLEMLAILERDEAMLELMETDRSVRALMHPPSERNVSIWLQCVLAAARLGRVEFVEEHRDCILPYAGQEEKACLLESMVALYKKKGLHEKYAAAKTELLSLLPDLPMHPYIAEESRKQIEQL